MFFHLFIAIEYACTLFFTVKGQCPDYALARASSVFLSSKGNRTVILNRQDFLPDTPPTEICCLYSQVVFQTFEEVFDSRQDSWRFYRWQGHLATRKSRSVRFKNGFSKVKLVSEVNCFESSNICLICSRSSLKPLKDINKNAMSTL